MSLQAPDSEQRDYPGRENLRTIRILVGLLMASAALFSASAATATSALVPIEEPVDGAPTEKDVQQSEEALRDDVATLAETFDVTQELAMEHFLAEEELDAFLEKLPSSSLRYFAGAWVDPLPGTAAHVRFTESIPADVISQLPANDRVELSIDGKMSLAELEGIAAKIRKRLNGLGLTEHSGRVDVKAGQVAVLASSQESEGIDVADALSELVSAELIDLELVDVPRISTEDHTYGGEVLRLNGTNKCTSAFTVSSDNGLGDGVLTAAHCTVNQAYSQFHGYAYSAPFKAAHYGDFGDMEWHTTTHTEYPWFYPDGIYLRAVNNLKLNHQMNVGDSVCRYGYKTGKACATVTGTNVWLGTEGSFVTTTNTNSDGGDSGGPWFYSTTAWGIHKGTVGPPNESFFSTVHWAENKLDVTLKTQ